MNAFYLSPNAVGMIPILILQIIFLAFLLSRRGKTTAVWLLTAWLASMFLVILCNFLSYALYIPASRYFRGMGSMVAALLAVAFWIQTAYYFPRLRRPREARLLRLLSLSIVLGFTAWMLYEILALPETRSYGFKDFYFGYFHRRATPFLRPANLFNLVHPLGYIWALLVWARQTATFSGAENKPNPPPDPSRPAAYLRQIGRALRRPHGKAAGASRAFFLFTLSGFVPVLGFLLEEANLLPPGTFPPLYLGMMTLIAITYINHAPTPTSFLVKLVGVPLVILLLAMGLVNRMALDAHTAAYRANILATVDVVKRQLSDADLDYAPPNLTYLLERPSGGGLLASDYQVRFSRDAALNLDAFRREDQWLQTELRRQRTAAFYAVWHEFPWLTAAQLNRGGLTVSIPAGAVSYRGVLGAAPDHFFRYFFTVSDRVYEVGFSYPAFRQALHQAALPLVALTAVLSLGILILLPLFYQTNLIRPLDNLLAAVRRVNAGDLQGGAPIIYDDEIGYLTGAFNKMVDSLRQEIAERRRAEEATARLNLTLEQRVLDRTRDLQVLYEVSAAASHLLDLDKLLAESLAKSVTALEGVAGAVFLLQEEALHRMQDYHWPPPLRAQTAVFPPDHALTQWVKTHHQPQLIDDVDRWLPGAAAVLPNILPLICPLQAAGEKLGLLVVARAAAQGFNVEEIALVISLGEQISGAVQANRLRRRAQRAAVLEERERIARDLHDSVTQALYGLVTFAEAGQAQLEAGAIERVDGTFARIGGATRQALKEMRLFIHQLRPDVLAEEGLAGALHLRLAAVEGRASVQARLLADETITLTPTVEEALYQIAQEALNNTLRHAGATAVTVYLSRENEQVVLEIIDDGCGFTPPAPDNGGMGLDNMQQRAAAIQANLKITTIPGRGTRVRVAAPIVKK